MMRDLEVRLDTLHRAKAAEPGDGRARRRIGDEVKLLAGLGHILDPHRHAPSCLRHDLFPVPHPVIARDMVAG
jgi:hypothetical protein